MEDLDKAIAKVIVTFDGGEEIRGELIIYYRESIVNNVQRKDILVGSYYALEGSTF